MRQGLLATLCFLATTVPQAVGLVCEGSPVAANGGTDMNVLLDTWAAGAACTGVVNFVQADFTYVFLTTKNMRDGDDWTFDASGKRALGLGLVSHHIPFLFCAQRHPHTILHFSSFPHLPLISGLAGGVTLEGLCDSTGVTRLLCVLCGCDSTGAHALEVHCGELSGGPSRSFTAASRPSEPVH